jgi:hypothetical protein
MSLNLRCVWQYKEIRGLEINGGGGDIKILVDLKEKECGEAKWSHMCQDMKGW